MSCKYKYNNQWYTKEDIFNLLLKDRNINSKGELIKPNTSTNYKWMVFSEVSDEGDTAFKDPYRGFIAEFDTKEEADMFAKSQYPSDLHYVKRGNSKGISPKTTNETLKESIESVRNKVLVDSYKEVEGWGLIINDEASNKKEYTSQALINTKISRLKEVAKKYPRNLIRGEVKRINTSSSQELYDQFGVDELPFQKISKEKQIEMLYLKSLEISEEEIEERIKQCE